MQYFSKLPLAGADKFAAILSEKEIEEEVSIGSWKLILAMRIRREMAEQKISKGAMCARIGINYKELNRILNDRGKKVTLENLQRAAHAVGLSVRMDFVRKAA
jgi:DNA-binding Xre family transcriptional regulator